MSDFPGYIPPVKPVDNIEIENKEDCPICCEELVTEKDKLRCQHSLCQKCLDNLKTETCPLCRAPLEGEAVKTETLTKIRQRVESQRELNIKLDQIYALITSKLQQFSLVSLLFIRVAKLFILDQEQLRVEDVTSKLVEIIRYIFENSEFLTIEDLTPENVIKIFSVILPHLELLKEQEVEIDENLFLKNVIPLIELSINDPNSID